MDHRAISIGATFTSVNYISTNVNLAVAISRIELVSGDNDLATSMPAISVPAADVACQKSAQLPKSPMRLLNCEATIGASFGRSSSILREQTVMRP
jgi:hypothetical protein